MNLTNLACSSYLKEELQNGHSNIKLTVTCMYFAYLKNMQIQQITV